MTTPYDDVEEAQRELRWQMGLDPRDEEELKDSDEEKSVEELSKEERADLQREQLREFMLGNRRNGIDK